MLNHLASKDRGGAGTSLVSKKNNHDLRGVNDHQGIIIFYLSDKGYGYLRLVGTQEEFHFRTKNMLVEGLAKGDMVRFKLKEGKQGYYADEGTRSWLA
jgi:cold shock CspA family protein